MKLGNIKLKLKKNIIRHPFFLCILLLFVTVAPLYAVTPTGTLHTEMLQLNTSIQADSNFAILESSPFVILLGAENRETNRASYTFEANAPMSLTITSENADLSTMRLQHTEIPEAYIPYTMYFDYAGLGASNETQVQNGVITTMEGFDIGYDILGTFSIVAPDDGMALAGDYVDTITFSFEAQ